MLFNIEFYEQHLRYLSFSFVNLQTDRITPLIYCHRKTTTEAYCSRQQLSLCHYKFCRLFSTSVRNYVCSWITWMPAEIHT